MGLKSLLGLVLLAISALAADECPTEPVGLTKGFQVDYYEDYRPAAPWKDLPGKLENLKPDYSINNITNVYFYRRYYDGSVTDIPRQGDIYGHEMNVNNFALVYTGYLRPYRNGDYTLEAHVDDYIYLEMSEGKAMDCCDNSEPSVNSNWTLSNKNDAGTHYTNKFTASLHAGYYYKVKIYYANIVYNHFINLTVSYGTETTEDLNIFNFDLAKQPTLLCESSSSSFIERSSDSFSESSSDSISESSFEISSESFSESSSKISRESKSTLSVTSTDYDATETYTTLLCPTGDGSCTEIEVNPPKLLSITSYDSTRSDTTTITLTASGSDSIGTVIVIEPSPFSSYSSESSEPVRSFASDHTSTSIDGCAECTRYTTTFSPTSNSDGSVVTESGVVEISKDSEGRLTTTTSLYSHSGCSNCEEFTTTFAPSTYSNGFVVTESAIIDVTTDSDGVLTTHTSFFLRNGCPECTEYITVFTSTDSEGSIVTRSGIVEVATESNGYLTTFTSIFPLEECSKCTKYTTTFAQATGEDGLVDPSSGVVEITTDIDGHLATSTSLFPNIHCQVCTKYITDIVSVVDSITVTVPCELEVTTNENHETVTKTVTDICLQCQTYVTVLTTSDSNGDFTTVACNIEVTTEHGIAVTKTFVQGEKIEGTGSNEHMTRVPQVTMSPTKGASNASSSTSGPQLSVSTFVGSASEFSHSLLVLLMSVFAFLFT